MNEAALLGRAIRKARKDRKLTIEQVATEVGIARASMNQWELGTTSPSHRNLLKLAAVLGVSVESLVSGSVAPTEEVASTSVENPDDDFDRLLAMAASAAEREIGFEPDPVQTIKWLMFKAGIKS